MALDGIWHRHTLDNRFETRWAKLLQEVQERLTTLTARLQVLKSRRYVVAEADLANLEQDIDKLVREILDARNLVLDILSR